MVNVLTSICVVLCPPQRPASVPSEHGHLATPWPADVATQNSVHTSSTVCSWPADDAVQAVWAGHACCLVQLDGVTFLTDPALSERVSGVQVVLLF
jgi:hypothetical protein